MQAYYAFCIRASHHGQRNSVGSLIGPHFVIGQSCFWISTLFWLQKNMSSHWEIYAINNHEEWLAVSVSWKLWQNMNKSPHSFAKFEMMEALKKCIPKAPKDLWKCIRGSLRFAFLASFFVKLDPHQTENFPRIDIMTQKNANNRACKYFLVCMCTNFVWYACAVLRLKLFTHEG